MSHQKILKFENRKMDKTQVSFNQREEMRGRKEMLIHYPRESEKIFHYFLWKTDFDTEKSMLLTKIKMKIFMIWLILKWNRVFEKFLLNLSTHKKIKKTRLKFCAIWAKISEKTKILRNFLAFLNNISIENLKSNQILTVFVETFAFICKF